MKKRSNLKFLSQSVVLEEAGLPKINSLIILVVFSMVISFIIWSATMKIDDVTTVKGFVIQEENGDIKFSFNARIPSNKIGVINEGLSVSINIPGINDNNPIKGSIENIKRTPITDEQGNIYYEAVVKPKNEKEIVKLDKLLMPNMKTNVKIITGRRTVLKYFLGPIFKSTKKSF